ncbi:MAG: prepilin-type N-terminal cleavage/methylation domain-containing protein [Candidatus Riflebacteria bacterium]|nr:prepilin-type N-terminal cleavage/methylation domain-containing protein [Candidatus Riflebacteria bacterium]
MKKHFQKGGNQGKCLSDFMAVSTPLPSCEQLDFSKNKFAVDASFKNQILPYQIIFSHLLNNRVWSKEIVLRSEKGIKSSGGQKGFTLVELLVAITIFLLCTFAIYSVFSHYSRSFMKIDDHLENIAEGWLALRILGDDILSMDVPDGNTKKWQEAITESGNGCTISGHEGGTMTKVSYDFDQTNHSLKRIINGKVATLIRNRCRNFLCKPMFTISTNSTIPVAIRVQVNIELLSENKQMEKRDKSLIIENCFFPELINMRLRSEYFHQGFPE